MNQNTIPSPYQRLFVTHLNCHYTLTMAELATPLGTMIAIADNKFLYLLEFVDCRKFEREIERLQVHMNATIVPGSTYPLQLITQELNAYFDGTLKAFTTPVSLFGTDFQKSVWYALTTIPYGYTRSYAEQAHAIGKPTAYRAVANANGANQLAIIIPCHRIITSNNTLGGYGGGITRKQWLLEHERKHITIS